MSTNGPIRIFTQTIASGATASTGVNIGEGWTYYHLVVPTMTSNTDIYVKVSTDGSTYFRHYSGFPRINSISAGDVFIIKSGVSQAAVDIPGGSPWVQIEHSTALTSVAITYKIVCS